MKTLRERYGIFIYLEYLVVQLKKISYIYEKRKTVSTFFATLTFG